MYEEVPGLVLAALAFAVVGCSDPVSSVTRIDEAGGRVEGGGSTAVNVPAGAVSVAVEIGIEELSPSSVAVLPDDTAAASSPYAFTPHGQTFDVPVTIELAYDPAAGDSFALVRLDDDADPSWEPVAEARFESGTASVETTHFSVYMAVALPPCTSLAPAFPDGTMVVTEPDCEGMDGGAGNTDAGSESFVDSGSDCRLPPPCASPGMEDCDAGPPICDEDRDAGVPEDGGGVPSFPDAGSPGPPPPPP